MACADVADPRLYRGGNRPRALAELAAEVEEAAAGDRRRGPGGEWKAVVFERRHFPNGEVKGGGTETRIGDSRGGEGGEQV